MKQFIAGFLIGAILFGGSVVYATDVTANPTTAKILVNGQESVVEAYNINGSNYLKLRDIASTVNFAVSWDGENIHIDTRQPYTQQDHDTSYSSKARAVYSPFKAGTIIKTEPVATSIGSVGGDYTITAGAEDKPWLTSDGTLWPNVVLPAWQSAWDSYPQVDLPQIAPVRFTGEIRGIPYDRLMVFNAYETERMVRTIYKFAVNNSSLWHEDGSPDFSIKVEYADDMVYNTFYPWRDWEVQGLVESTGPGKVFRIYAIDVYNNSAFIDTEYFMK